MKTRPTHEKRRKEQSRKERQRDKAEKRAQRKQARADGTDPDEPEDGTLLSTEDGEGHPSVDVPTPNQADMESRSRSSTVPLA